MTLDQIFEDQFIGSVNLYFPVFWAIFAFIAGIIIARFVIAWITSVIRRAILPDPKPQRNWDALQPQTPTPRGD